MSVGGSVAHEDGYLTAILGVDVAHSRNFCTSILLSTGPVIKAVGK